MARRWFRLETSQAVQGACVGGLTVLAVGILLRSSEGSATVGAEIALLVVFLIVAVAAVIGTERLDLRPAPALATVAVAVGLMSLGTGIDSAFYYLLLGLGIWHGVSLTGRLRLASQGASLVGMLVVWAGDRVSVLGPGLVIGRLVGLAGGMTLASVLGDQLRRARRVAEQAAAERGALVARVNDLRDSERRLLATDLHDEVVQGLSSSAFELAAARRLLAAGRIEDALSCLGRAEEGVEREVRAVRTLMFGLWPVGLESLGLAAALSESLDRFALTAGLTADLEVVGQDGDLDPALTRILYRAHQEAMENVRKHAEASQVHTRLKVDHEQVILEITDDGRGFTPIRARAPGHIGLAGLDAWARDAGGRVDVESSPGLGTTVAITLPRASRAELRPVS